MHALIRDGAYASLLKTRRGELHLRAAAWYAARDPGLHAEHLALADSPLAAAAFRDAARSKAQRYRNAEALAAFTQARDAAEGPADAALANYEMVSEVRLAVTLRRSGAGDEALALAREAWQLCTEVSGQGSAGPLVLIEIAIGTPDPAEAEAALQQAEQLLAQGTVAHNHLFGLPDAMRLRLARGVAYAPLRTEPSRLLAQAQSAGLLHSAQELQQALDALTPTAPPPP